MLPFSWSQRLLLFFFFFKMFLLSFIWCKAKLKCTDTFRQMSLATNGLASLHVLDDNIDDAIELYRGFINESKSLQKDFSVDKLQLIHAIHNLVLGCPLIYIYLLPTSFTGCTPHWSPQSKAGNFERYGDSCRWYHSWDRFIGERRKSGNKRTSCMFFIL